MAAREAGAGRIVAIDVLPSKFDLARACGATDCVDARSADAIAQVLDMTDGGVDYAFECVGYGAVMAQAYGWPFTLLVPPMP